MTQHHYDPVGRPVPQRTTVEILNSLEAHASLARAPGIGMREAPAAATRDEETRRYCDAAEIAGRP